ncbi:MAG: hypothetical protein B6U68_04130 [Candidatus Aenigmarchaeota archaeon ex4484_14]|nr:MAG: hypothetical protein B6U68_04130 [Candidatus Aenigmarchaeota archaeon ex4484_14]
MIVICLVGFSGSGKTLVAKHFENTVYVTDIIKKEIEKKTKNFSEELIKDTYYLNLYKHEDLLTKNIINKLLSKLEKKIKYIFLDDVKTKLQIKNLKKYFSVKIISVESHKADRINRLSALGFELWKILQWEKYCFDIRLLQNQADYKILNFGTLKNLSAEINKLKNSWLPTI